MGIVNKVTCVECGTVFIYETQNHGSLRKYCSDECKRARNQRNSPEAAICRNCGKKFRSRGGIHRECCTKSCAVAEIQRQTADMQNTAAKMTIREWAVSLCISGYGYNAAAEALGLSRWVLKSWVEQYRNYGSLSGNLLRYSYRSAQSPDEWIEELHAELASEKHNASPVADGRRIFVVCGKLAGKHTADRLSAIVGAGLRMNPYDGNVYAFCGGGLDALHCLYWDGTGFIVVTRRCEYGKYPWPGAKVGRFFEITPEDLGLILSGRCKNPEKA